MRKVWLCTLVFAIVLLMVSSSFAEPRNPTSSETKTAFTNIAVVGINYPANPGYIELTDGDGVEWYMWISTTGSLHVASREAVGFRASPATIGWEDISGVVVGNQVI